MIKTQIISVENLTKQFANFVAVDHISFSITEGEIVGLLGPNGAGKTTTIQMLLGLITPSAGSINIFGKEFKKHREEILAKMNFSSTYTHLPWRLSIWENLYVVALLYDVANPKERVAQVIKMMGLEGWENKTIDQLSSGWLTRVNLARTFINSPSLFLLDEPTAALDPEAACNIRQEIRKYQRQHNITILWTSHNMAEVEEMCDRVIFLDKGKIIADDTPDNLAKLIITCRVDLLITDGIKKLKVICDRFSWRIENLDRFIRVHLSDDKIPELLNELAKNKIEYSEISIEKPTLEDFFISRSQI